MKLKRSHRNQRELTRFLKFSVVGVIGFIIDAGTFNLFANILGLASVLASTLSFTAAVTSNFIWNRFWTYPDSRSKTIRQQAFQFAIISVIGLGVRTVIFLVIEGPLINLSDQVLHSYVGQNLPGWIPPEVINPVVIGNNLTLALAVVIVLLWNFFANRYWTYSDAE